MTRRVLLLLGVLLLTTTAAATAWGFWGGTGTGSGTASAGSLAAPTGVTATVAPGATTVGVSWTASARATGYSVTRVRNSNGTTAAVCTTTQTTCTDADVADGTYHYVVTALYASWTASAGSSDVTVLNAPPSVTVNQAAGQADPTATVPIKFTAVFSESVSDFTSAGVTVSPASATVGVTGSGTTYSISVSDLTGSGPVTVSIGAGVVHDSVGAGNTTSTSTDNSVLYDVTLPTAPAPVATASLSFNNFVGNAAVTLTDAATDAHSGVASVAYYRCTGATGSCTAANWTALGTSTAAGYALTSGVPFAADGSYRVVAVATDAVGNVSAVSPATVVIVDTTPPTVSRPIVNGHP